MRVNLNAAERAFVTAQRVARLATADANGVPYLVPVCFALIEKCVYITIDRKPKRSPGRELKRERNIRENPAVALTVDRYDDDWRRLGWVMLRGAASILRQGSEYGDAQASLRERYPQYREMYLADLPVIAIHVERVTSWGNLDP